MQIFSNEHLVQFSYQIYMTNKGIFHYDQEPGMTFKCQFPFFWLIKEAIDSNVEMIGFSFGKIFMQVIHKNNEMCGFNRFQKPSRESCSTMPYVIR